MTRLIPDARQAPLLILPDSTWTPPRVAELPDFSKFDQIGFDTETKDPRLLTWGSGWPIRDGHVVGYSFDVPGKSYYLPIRHPEDNVDDPDQLLNKLRHETRRFRGKLVGLNLAYDLGWSFTDDIEFPDANLVDVGFNEAAINESETSYSLNNIAKRRGVGSKDETLLRQAAASYGVDPKGGMWQIPARFVGRYAEEDGALPGLILKTQLPQIAKQKLERVLELEHALIPMMLAMRRRGVRIDVDRAERTRLELREKRDAVLAEIKHQSGISMVNPFDVQECSAVLRQQGVSFPRTVTGKPSFQAAWLEKQSSEPCRLIVKARRYHKAERDFIGGMILDHQVNGRIHASFEQMRSDEGGAITGRFTCKDPNLQQAPARDPEISPMIRSLFLPEEGEEWAAIDYAAQEPRLSLHYANLLKLPGAADAVNVYLSEEAHDGEYFTAGPRTDWHGMVARFTGLPRKRAKTINLAIPYGARGKKICETMGLPTEWIDIRDRETGETIQIEVAGEEGKRVLTTYHTRFPFMQKLMNECDTQARERGFIRTIGGRMLHFNLWEPRARVRGFIQPPLPWDQAVERYGANSILVRHKTYKALNKLIQGSAADMIKHAMLALWRAGKLPLATIHDELGFSVKGRRDALEAEEIMVNCMKLAVPLVCDIDFGRSWGEARPMSRVEEE